MWKMAVAAFEDCARASSVPRSRASRASSRGTAVEAAWTHSARLGHPPSLSQKGAEKGRFQSRDRSKGAFGSFGRHSRVAFLWTALLGSTCRGQRITEISCRGLLAARDLRCALNHPPLADSPKRWLHCTWPYGHAQ